jgi:hypothetical protein
MGALVCAKLVDAARPRITAAQLRARNNLPRSADRQERPTTLAEIDWRVWVAVEQLVYDVTGGFFFSTLGHHGVISDLLTWWLWLL